MLKLYTFNISHFSEKARWALDFEGIDYEEQVLLPGPHQLVTRRIARRTHVPVLQHDHRYVQGSSAILDYLAEQLGGNRLTPRDAQAAARVRELEASIDHAFGLGVQRVLYSVMLDYRSTVTDLWAFGGPAWARTFYAVAYPLVAAVVKRMYKTTDPGKVQEARDRFVHMFDELDARLAQAPYLGGEQPGRLDITVAALLAPVCRPPEHRMPWPEIPEELQAFEASLSGRPTWHHALRMYREHRQSR
jgi:glutathione S-transferase